MYHRACMLVELRMSGGSPSAAHESLSSPSAWSDQISRPLTPTNPPNPPTNSDSENESAMACAPVPASDSDLAGQ